MLGFFAYVYYGISMEWIAPVYYSRPVLITHWLLILLLTLSSLLTVV